MANAEKRCCVMPPAPQGKIACEYCMLVPKSMASSKSRAKSCTLFGAEDLVAGVAQPGQDVTLLVQALVNGADIDVDLRMNGRDPGKPLRRSHQAEHADLEATRLFQYPDGSSHRAAG